MSILPGALARRARHGAACGALVLVVSQGVASMWTDWSEMRHWDWARHQSAVTATASDRIRAALEEDWDVWQAIDEHVPPDRRLIVSYPIGARGPRLSERLQHLRTLRCPVGLKGVPLDPRSNDSAPPVIVSEFVLDLDSGQDYSAYPGTEELARGDGYRLLVVRSER